MRALFVRHAKAVEADRFDGRDMERPLTDEGRADARRLFANLARCVSGPDLIVSSEAVRAVQTAELLRDALGGKYRRSAELNPGCGIAEMRRVFAALPSSVKRVAFVGHEPDFSEIISRLIADGPARIQVKKASCIEVALDVSLESGELCFLLPPSILRAMG